MITLIDVNTCEKLGFDSVIKETHFGLKMQNNLKSSNFELNISWSNYHFQIQNLLKTTINLIPKMTVLHLKIQSWFLYLFRKINK